MTSPPDVEDEDELVPRGIPGGRRLTDQAGFITITNREVYDRLGLVASRVDEVATKLDPLTVDLAAIRVELVDHESRLRALERKAWLMAGAAAVIGAGAAKLATLIGV